MTIQAGGICRPPFAVREGLMDKKDRPQDGPEKSTPKTDTAAAAEENGKKGKKKKSSMLKIGSVVAGKYKVLYEVGHGGTSHVYLALNEAANKEWAIKEICKERDGVRQHPETETSIMKKLKHPHLPRIIDVIETEDTYLILMDYIQGKTLKKVVRDEGAQKQEDVVDWALQLCDVLEYLHSLKPQIIYRDMKPENVMIKPDGTVYLIDFGIAREYKEDATSDTRALGTVGYAAPEQYGGEGQTDERTDIYAMGATMYELVTGKDPAKAPYEMRPIRKWNPALSSGLESIIIKCTRNDPDERYQNAAELRYALLNYKKLDKEYRNEKRKQFRRFAAAAVSGIVCIGLSIGTKVYAGTLLNSTYDAQIRAAQTAVTQDKQVEAYMESIKTDPQRADAYDQLLNRVFLADGNFTTQEAEQLSKILGYKGNGDRMTAEERFKKNREGYDRFCYDYGLAYFYYYNETGNKQLSGPWFMTAKESEVLDSTRKNRASRLYAIADYYAQLGNRNKAGDNTASYKTYWDDMAALSDGDIAGEDNIQTALVVYREFAYQIGAHAKEFKAAGVTEREIRRNLEKIQENMEWIMESDDFDEVNSSDAANAVLANIDSAEKVLDTVFFE